MNEKKTTQAETESMSVEEIQARLFAVIDEYAKRNLTPHYEGEHQRPLVLGLMMSTAFLWDGACIMQAAAEALEDANYHDDAAALRAKAGGD
jgi:hypothetical protein